MIIGLTGTNGSGKDTVAELLVSRGFKRYSCSDVIREECKRQGLSLDRENQIATGNKLRQEHGPGYLGKVIAERISIDKPSNVVVVSIRHPAEVASLKEIKDHFTLLFVDADIKTRYSRILVRQHEVDKVDFETFKDQQHRELTGSGVEQQILKVKELANAILMNDGDLNELKNSIASSLKWSRFEKERDNWDVYFMKIAKQVAKRSTCDRLHVGAVIVKNKTILSTGYNGSIKGMAHCDDEGHMMEDSHCVATIHAEANAIIQAAKNGVCVDEADIYVTFSPCWICFKMLANAGIKNIFYETFYRDERIEKVAEKLGKRLIQVKVD